MALSAVLALVVAAVPPAADRESASLTLQGAASLGTYEAGFSWTLIRLARGDRLLHVLPRHAHEMNGAIDRATSCMTENSFQKSQVLW